MAQSTKNTEPTNDPSVAQTTAVAPSPAKAHDVDAVAMASRRSDGTPDQTPGFVYLDPETAEKATAQQLGEQRASAVDQVERATAGAVDPEALKSKHEAALSSAESDAKAEVKEHS